MCFCCFVSCPRHIRGAPVAYNCVTTVSDRVAPVFITSKRPNPPHLRFLRMDAHSAVRLSYSEPTLRSALRVIFTLTSRVMFSARYSDKFTFQQFPASPSHICPIHFSFSLSITNPSTHCAPLLLAPSSCAARCSAAARAAMLRRCRSFFARLASTLRWTLAS